MVNMGEVVYNYVDWGENVSAQENITTHIGQEIWILVKQMNKY